MSKILNFFILLFYIKFNIFLCQACQRNESLLNSKCFNNILYINENFRAGYLAKNKNGDIIVEYSTLERRLFYGIKNSGKFYYDNIPYTKQFNVTILFHKNENFFERYESRNKFISLKDDSNKTKEYLLSISSYKSLIEIYDIENDALYRHFEDIIFADYIYSYQFMLLDSKINKQNIYFCIYNTALGTNFIEKFYFSKQETDETILINNNKNISFSSSLSRIINAFLVNKNDNTYICVIYVNSDTCNPYIIKYDSDLGNDNQINLDYICISKCNLESWIYSSLYLKNNYAAIIYFNAQLYLELTILEVDNYNNIILKEEMNFDCPGHLTLFNFYKINDERVVFVSARGGTMRILFIDFYQNYKKIKSRLYLLNSDDYVFYKDLSLEVSNDFLTLSVTVSKDKEIEQYKEKDDNCFSLFMIFGYPNGTDNEINISPYLYNSENYDSNLNLVMEFFENFIIDNNILGHEKIENKVKLSNISEGIKLYNLNDESNELRNSDILESNYKLIQNNNIIKNNEYHYLEYQFIVKEPDYSIFYNNIYNTFGYSNDMSGEFEPKILYGRTNTLKFKLCHKFCKTCKTLGISDNEQKCLSCLPEYQYDYFNISKTNCVPEGYYYDININQLIKCNEDNFTFIKDNITDKTFCFPTVKEEIKTTEVIETQTEQEEIKTTQIFEANINGFCPYLNYSNNDILHNFIPNLIKSYNNSLGSFIIIKCNKNATFLITNYDNENFIYT